MSSSILNFWLAIIRQSWRFEIFLFLIQPRNWSKIEKLFLLGVNGSGYLHDIGNATMIIRFLHSDFAPNLSKQQNQELTTQLEYLSNIVIEGQNLLSEEPISSQHFDVRECLEESIELFKAHPQSNNCTLHIKGRAHFDLFGPPTILMQAICNILQNSAQALYGQKNKEISITLTQQKHFCTITIHDNGPGFPKGFTLQPFHTEKEDGNGIGLWHSLLQLKRHFLCTSTFSNLPSGGAQTKLYFWKHR